VSTCLPAIRGAPNPARSPLTSEGFKEAIDLLHRGKVQALLANGENPLAMDRSGPHIVRLFSAAHEELHADLADVLRAANAGASAEDLAGLAVEAIDQHLARLTRLLTWLQDLGLPMRLDHAGVIKELAGVILAHADWQLSPTVTSPAFAALTDALWQLLDGWEREGLFLANQMQRWRPPAGPCRTVRTAGDVWRNLYPIFGWFKRLGEPAVIKKGSAVAPLRCRLAAEDLQRLIHRLDIADGCATRLPCSLVLIGAGSRETPSAAKGGDGAAHDAGPGTPAYRAAVAPPVGEQAPASGHTSEPGPLQSPANRSRSRMTREAANNKAMELARNDQSFVCLSQREWARRIGCSIGLIQDLPLWQQTMKKTGRGRKGRDAPPTTVSLTDRLERVTGENDPELARLIGEQQADAEPSPLQDDPPGDRPRKVYARKRV
jgi:hypothetical protein